MKPTIDTAAIESLRRFAADHGELQFSHMCTAALAGEEWAVERVDEALEVIATDAGGLYTDATRLEVIRATDTTRPDGVVARATVEV